MTSFLTKLAFYLFLALLESLVVTGGFFLFFFSRLSERHRPRSHQLFECDILRYTFSTLLDCTLYTFVHFGKRPASTASSSDAFGGGMSSGVFSLLGVFFGARLGGFSDVGTGFIQLCLLRVLLLL